MIGKIFDDRGNRMTPVTANKNGKRYRYYISSALHQGMADKTGSITRVPADQIEQLVANAVQQQRQNTDQGPTFKAPLLSQDSQTQLLRTKVQRIDVGVHTLNVTFNIDGSASAPDAEVQEERLATVSIPWSKRASKVAREIITQENPTARPKPIRSENRARLVTAIAHGRSWLRDLCDGKVQSTEELASRERCSVRQVNMTLSLALLSPKLVTAAIEGRLPRGIGVAALRDLSPNWAEQHKSLGLSA